MANLYSGTHEFSGYKTLSELTGLTLEDGKKYSVQVIQENNSVYLREGSIGTGFIYQDVKPFELTHDAQNELYIGSNYEKSMYINVSD